jgi:hypothetical protein
VSGLRVTYFMGTVRRRDLSSARGLEPALRGGPVPPPGPFV